MKLRLLTWNSQNINSGAFSSYIQVGQLANINQGVVIANRPNDFPALNGIIKQPSVLIIGIVITPGNDINTYRETLKGYFFGDDLRHSIIAEDLNNSSIQYSRSGYPTRFVQEAADKPNSFYVTIQTEYPYWQLVSPTSDSWDITASSDSDIVSNSGNLPVAPIFTITPTVTKTEGYKYWRYVSIYNTLNKVVNLPLDITNGGLDVQSLINAGKMQSDGDDFRVWGNGSFTDRWLYGMDSDSDPAKCWVNIYLDAKQEAQITAAIDSDDTTITFDINTSNLSFLEFLKTALNFTLLIDNEAVVFDPVNINTITYEITNLSRGQKNTTAASHSINSIVRYITNDLFILYGDSDATVPYVNDDNKPIFDLSSSNAAWRYTYYYDDTKKNRPGTWKPEVKLSRTKLSYYFTDNNNTFTSIADTLGLAERNSSDFTAGHETATLAWSFSHPSGITDISYSGEKYKTGSWPGIVGLQKLQENLVWITVVNETAPTVTEAWELFSNLSTSLSGTYSNIRFVIDGTLSSAFDEAAMVQFDSVEMSFDSDNLPVLSVGSEASINFFNFKLTNNTTGEYIKVTTPCPINTPLVVDCEQRKAYLSDGRQVPVLLSSNRESWLNLQPGNNTLIYEDDGTAGVTIVISHRDKIL